MAQPDVKQTDKQAEKIPGRWGLSEARFISDCENELVTVHLRGGETLTGYVIGLDQFGIGFEVTDTPRPLWLMKHAIDYIVRG